MDARADWTILPRQTKPLIFALSRNEELPRDFRLSDELFQMTTFTYNDIRAKTEEKLNLVSLDLFFQLQDIVDLELD